MKKFYSLLLTLLAAVSANAADVVELNAYPSRYTGQSDSQGEYIYEDGDDFTVSASIEGNKVTFPNFLDTGLDYVTNIFEDHTVGHNITEGYRHTGINLGSFGSFEHYFVYNETEATGYNAFYYFEEDGEKWLIYYVYAYNGSSSNANENNMEVYVQMPDDFVPGVIGDFIDAEAAKASATSSYDVDICGTIDDVNKTLTISNFLGYPYPINISWDESTGAVTTTIPQSWDTGYFVVGSSKYYYVRDFYQSAYNSYVKSALGRYISLYLSLSPGGSTEDLYYVTIYLPDDGSNADNTEGTISAQVYTEYNSTYTELEMTAKVSDNVYVIPNFLGSDLEVTIVADKEAGTVESNLPTGQMKKTFYINDVKFTYIYGYNASYSEWGVSQGEDYFDLAFQLYSSATNWTWVYVYIFPNTFTSGVSDISVDESNAPVEIFNLNGIKVNSDSLTPGLYIRRQGSKTSKFIAR